MASGAERRRVRWAPRADHAFVYRRFPAGAPDGSDHLCQYRAAEWRHKDIELAAHELLQHLDSTRA